jgi:3-oxoacyl-[acyl-carrier protein] reductase
MDKKRILITGSTRGIGREIARKLVGGGYKVTVHGRSKEDSLRVAQELSADDALAFDVTNRASAKDVLERIVEEKGAYWGIVLSTGLARDNTFVALSDEDWDVVLASSLDGFYNVLHPLMLPLVRLRSGGRVVVLSSVSGVTGNRGQVNYSAAKAGLIGAAKALAVELATRNITVNCVAPGLIDTEMIRDVPIEEALKIVPMGRLGKPEEVAALVAFLMSEEASYITRQVIGVNGGII